jgi:hypothetical protein
MLDYSSLWPEELSNIPTDAELKSHTDPSIFVSYPSFTVCSICLICCLSQYGLNTDFEVIQVKQVSSFGIGKEIFKKIQAGKDGKGVR